MARILIADEISGECVEILRKAGHEVDNAGKLTLDALKARVRGFQGLIVRSGVKVTADVIGASDGLKVIGRAGVGVDNIDVPAATKRGIAVLNAPEGNVAAAAEHTVAMLTALARNLAHGHAALSAGKWDRKSFTGVELEGKTLGVVGLGKVGARVAKVAQALGMEVVAFDPFLSRERARELGVEAVEFDALLERSDFVTLHTPLTEQTKGLFGERAFRKMRKSARLVNVARGGIVDEAALVKALDEKWIAGAALDVFESEPPPADHPLLKRKDVTVTPHLGASTEEAQIKVAEDIARQFNEYFGSGALRNAVNVAGLQDPQLEPFLRLAQDLGALAFQLVGGRVQAVEVAFRGDFGPRDAAAIAPYALKGVLAPIVGDSVNPINARLVAQERGIRVTESRTADARDYRRVVGVRVTTDAGAKAVEGTLFEGGEPRIIRIDEFRIDLKPSTHMLALFYPDRPGMVGRFGTILGKHGVNIARMEVGRLGRGRQAVMLLSVDDPVGEAVLEEIRREVEHVDVRAIRLD